MIQLFGNPFSTCTRKVLTVLAETNTPFEMTVIDFAKNEHKGAANLSRQPFGQIPQINDGGFALFESRAICRYLAEKAGSSLIPTDIMKRAVMEQWISVEQSNFSPAAMKYVYHYVFKRPQEQSVLDNASAMIETCCAALSKQFNETPYLAGDEFTIADIGYMPYIEYTINSPLKAVYEKSPRVMSWWQRISERPSWIKVARS